MFKSSIKMETLRELVDVISTLVDEAKFAIDKDGIVIKAVDPAHVAMVDLTLGKGGFEEYKADDAELGMDIDKIKEVLKLARPGEMISIEYKEDLNQMVFKVGNITRRMSLVDTAGMSDPKVPSLSLPSKLTLNTADLRQGIRAAESVSDHIVLVASSDGFEAISEGDTDSVMLKLAKGQGVEKLECKETVRSLFPLDYFSNMIKAISAASTVDLSMGNDYPVRMDFKIGSGAGSVTYLLAPRIEND